VSASINVWSHVNDLWSQGVVDTLRYIAGELKTSDVTEGTYVRDWAKANEAGSGGLALPGMSKDEVEKRMASAVGVDQTKFRDLSRDGVKNLDPALLQAASKVRNKMRDVRADAKATSVAKPIYQQRLDRAKGTELEAELMTPMMQQMTGVEGMPLNDAVMDVASPLRGANPSVQRNVRLLKEVALADRGACIMQEAPAPVSFAGLGDILQEKFGKFDASESKDVQVARGERMRKYLAQRAQYAVIIHEMGHSVGMRHNFVSSSDAFNYRPQYWQLRTKNGTVTDACADYQDDGSGCVGPRYFDPVTPEERDNLIWMWSQSSVMDYAGEATQDLIGLGSYDFAAVRMFYGDAVAVHADPSYNAEENRGIGMLAKMDNFGGILGFDPQVGPFDPNSGGIRSFHYSEYHNEYELIKNCETIADPQIFKPSDWNDERDGIWHPIIDGLIVEMDGVYSRCEQQKVDYIQWNQLRGPNGVELGGNDPEDLESGIFYSGGPSVDSKSGRTRVPYGFATDRWADLGNLSVYRHDNGADPYELFNFLISQQEIGHIFDNYRRNRQSFSVRGAAGRRLGRYNEKMRDAAKGLGLLYNIYKDFSADAGYNFDDFWPVLAPEFFPENLIASGIGFDHFSRQIQRPEPGPHYRPNGQIVLKSPDSGFTNGGVTRVIIPNGATGYHEAVGFGGMLMENTLATDKGEYDASYTMNAGSYYDKVYATMLFAESVDNFISDSLTDFLDPRYRAVSLADLFPDGFRRMLANNLADDEEIKGVRLVADSSGNPELDTTSTDPNPEAKQFPAQPIGLDVVVGDQWSRGVLPGDGQHRLLGLRRLHVEPLQPPSPREHDDRRPPGRLRAAEVPDRLDARVHPRERPEALARHDERVGDRRRYGSGLRQPHRVPQPDGPDLRREDLRRGRHLRQDGPEGHLGPHARVGEHPPRAGVRRHRGRSRRRRRDRLVRADPLQRPAAREVRQRPRRHRSERQHAAVRQGGLQRAGQLRVHLRREPRLHRAREVRPAALLHAHGDPRSRLRQPVDEGHLLSPV
jgi:hypothetical protein